MNNKKLFKIKQLLPFEIREIGNYEPKDLVEKLNEMHLDCWLEESWRAKKFKVHSNTQSLNIFWDQGCLKEDRRGKKHEKNYNYLGFEQVLKDLKPLYEKEFGSGEFYRVLITKLDPCSTIPPHCDVGLSLMKARRTHIPLITNSDVEFMVGEDLKPIHLEVGKVYELNNARKHSVFNPTDKFRIHLIIDWLQDKGFWLNDR